MNGEVSMSKQFVYVWRFAQEKAIRWGEGNQIALQSPYIHFYHCTWRSRRCWTPSQLSLGKGKKNGLALSSSGRENKSNKRICRTQSESFRHTRAHKWRCNWWLLTEWLIHWKRHALKTGGKTVKDKTVVLTLLSSNCHLNDSHIPSHSCNAAQRQSWT